jgi:hypothetical protein
VVLASSIALFSIDIEPTFESQELLLSTVQHRLKSWSITINQSPKSLNEETFEGRKTGSIKAHHNFKVKD